MDNIAMIGSRIANGALILRSNGEHVLAIFRNEYVTWTVYRDGTAIHACWGDYYGNDEEAAYSGYAEKISKVA